MTPAEMRHRADKVIERAFPRYIRRLISEHERTNLRDMIEDAIADAIEADKAEIERAKETHMIEVLSKTGKRTAA